ncbi:MAG TPA: TonB C-terminal domain-containing protein, partial [Casimicrobiaceae bacterium]|nr:TonB C-terminal domain-containing protein [Casimicrobiaceae bacterium]
KAEAAKAEAAKAEAAKLDAAKAEAAEAAARVEAARRAIGRQLDEEAARRDAASRLSPSSSGVRRYRLFGRTDPNAELILYAEAWARKIQLNMTFDMVREAAKQRHADPLVTVAIRSDGSVESVTFVQSSGVPAIDDAIRRIVYSQTPYQVFPPSLASEFDVIEIRRTWYFDVAIRLY